jgi:hypothetical protein
MGSPDQPKPRLIDKVEPAKILDLIVNKQSHYYSLWGVYTAVQFAAGSFGLSGQSLSLSVGLSVLLGVWAFNLGHLGFVLRCVEELNKLSKVLAAAQEKDDGKAYRESLDTLKDMQEAGYFWNYFKGNDGSRSYSSNICVHLFIDICASVALLSRIEIVQAFVKALWQRFM